MEYKISPELLGEKIKILRKSAKYTQETFSELIGIEPQNLSRIERGLNYPSLITFVKISEVLKVKPNDLLNVDAYESEKVLEDEIILMAKNFSLQEKRIIFKIMKSFMP